MSSSAVQLMTLLLIVGYYSFTVVINGERKAVDLKLNTAYSLEEGKTQIHATNPAAALQHYEDVDVL